VSSVYRSAITLLIGMGLFIGLPLAGWGLRDMPGFFGHPARLSYVVLAILLQVIVVIRLPGAGRDRGRKKKIVRRKRLALMLLQVIPLIIVIAGPYDDRRNIAVLSRAEMFRYLGLVLFCSGFAAMHWAEQSLGRQFSVRITIQEDHQLVTTGPYRYIRHPRYLGIIIFTIGFSLVYRSWMTLILVAALALVLIWRIHGEESLLHQEFGTDWETYSRTSWRLIPFVY
jgi:protein-S-isoprenylcysteine O-methyltransferase Ste14